MNDLISRKAAIDALKKISFSHWFECGEYLSEDTREIEIINSNKALEAIEALPSAQPEQKDGKWTTEQVAELLANMFGEECACNFNGIDEWLPSACKYSETTCPNPKEKHGCWMQFLIQGGTDMKGEDNDA